jgi:chlorite dismutase
MQPPAPASRQLVSFTFFHVLPSWRQLPAEARAASKREFAAVVERHAARVAVRGYSTVGTRGDVDFCLRCWSTAVEDFAALHGDLLATALGAHLTRPHAFLGALGRLAFVPVLRHPDDPERGLTHDPGGRRYAFIYPFVKSRDWYLLPDADRQRMMEEHQTIGRAYPGLAIATAYSFGLDDQEYVTAFESDSLGDYLDLVMELRASEASRSTVRDTPSFTCLAMPIAAALDLLGG